MYVCMYIYTHMVKWKEQHVWYFSQVTIMLKWFRLKVGSETHTKFSTSPRGKNKWGSFYQYIRS